MGTRSLGPPRAVYGPPEASSPERGFFREHPKWRKRLDSSPSACRNDLEGVVSGAREYSTFPSHVCRLKRCLENFTGFAGKTRRNGGVV